MILTCPQCKTKFSLADNILMPEGRMVRCSKCKHDWFQAPDVEENEADEGASSDGGTDSVEGADGFGGDGFALADVGGGDDFGLQDSLTQDSGNEADDADGSFEGALKAAQDIQDELSQADDLEAVQPDIPLSVVKAANTPASSMVSAVSALGVDRKTIVSALIVFVVVFFSIFGVLTVMRTSIVRAWPPMNALYGAMGMAWVPDARTLSFNGLDAVLDKDGEIQIMGDLVNLSTQDTKLPFIHADLLDEHEAVLKSWVIAPPVEHLEGGEQTAFASTYPMDEHAQYVRLKFTLGGGAIVAEVGAKDGEGHDEGHQSKPLEEPGHNGGHGSGASHGGAPKSTPGHAPAASGHQGSHGH